MWTERAGDRTTHLLIGGQLTLPLVPQLKANHSQVFVIKILFTLMIFGWKLKHRISPDVGQLVVLPDPTTFEVEQFISSYLRRDASVRYWTNLQPIISTIYDEVFRACREQRKHILFMENHVAQVFVLFSK